MNRTGRTAFLAVIAVTGVILSGCMNPLRPADRTDTFASEGAECVASWWIGEPHDGFDDETREIALKALAEAEVTPESYESALSLVEFGQSTDEYYSTTQVEREREARMWVITFYVQNELDLAGYPDINRALEIYSDVHCT